MKKLIAMLAVTTLAASPVTATVRDAAFASSGDRAQPQTSMFVGATYHVGLNGSSNRARGRASLHLGAMMKTTDASDLRIGRGLEIAGGRAGKPALLIAGHDARDLGDRSHLSTGATVALVVVGVVVIAGVTAALLIDERLDRQNSE